MEKFTLESSRIDRQNILNNTPAIRHIEQELGLPWYDILWWVVFTKKQIAEYFDVDIRTIDRYIEQNGDELRQNWYKILTGESLSEAKKAIGNDIDVVTTTRLWVFSFSAFLNIWMLLTESENAKELRKIILKIVIDYINQRAWWNTKYINHNDQNFIKTYKDSLYYRKAFTDALSDCIEWSNHKFPYFTDAVYQAIFWESALQYKKLLKLSRKENARHTFYAEVLGLISAFENWFASELRKQNKKLNFFEAKELFDSFKKNPIFEPLLEQARNLMASRDVAFRDIIHETISPYIQALPKEEYEKFCAEHAELIGQKSQEFLTIIDENEDVLIRLKDK